MNDWKKDFEDFKTAAPVPPPGALFHQVRESIRRELTAHPSAVFGKLVAIQLFSGALTLLICPQFGLGPLGGGTGVMGWVMPYGTLACAALCGGVFLGSSSLVALFVLREGEQRVLRSGFWQFPGLGTLFIGLLMGISRLAHGGWFAFDPTFFGGWLVAGSVIAYGILWGGTELRQKAY